MNALALKPENRHPTLRRHSTPTPRDGGDVPPIRGSHAFAQALGIKVEPQRPSLRVLPDPQSTQEVAVWPIPDVEMSQLDWALAESERAKRNLFFCILALAIATVLAATYLGVPIFSPPDSATVPMATVHKGNGIAVVQVEVPNDYYDLAQRIGALEPGVAGSKLAAAFDNSELEPGRTVVIDTARLGIATTHWQP